MRCDPMALGIAEPPVIRGIIRWQDPVEGSRVSASAVTERSETARTYFNITAGWAVIPNSVNDSWKSPCDRSGPQISRRPLLPIATYWASSSSTPVKWRPPTILISPTTVDNSLPLTDIQLRGRLDQGTLADKAKGGAECGHWDGRTVGRGARRLRCVTLQQMIRWC